MALPLIILTSGSCMLACPLGDCNIDGCTYILTTRAPVPAKNKFAITSMSSSSWNLIQYMGSFTQVHKIVNKLK